MLRLLSKSSVKPSQSSSRSLQTYDDFPNVRFIRLPKNFGLTKALNIGVRAEIPIGNEILEARVNSAILTRLRRLATRDARKLAIQTEVYDTLDTLTQSWQRILAARLEAILAARTLAAEQRQFDVGLRTSIEVLDANARLADAQSREVQALGAYQIALVDLAFATGTSLGAAQIDWSPFSPEELEALEQATSGVTTQGGAKISGNP